MAVRADVSKVADIDQLFAATIEQYGRVDRRRERRFPRGQPKATKKDGEPHCFVSAPP
jgi:hypothetical protein